MKTIGIVIYLLIVSFSFSIAQEVKDKTLYSQGQSLDSSITPDLYEIEVTISEYYVYPEEKRNSKIIKINLDSIKQLVLAELAKIGIKNKVMLAQIIERDYQAYPAEAMLKASYRFTVSAKDSIEIIYTALTGNLPTASFRRFDVTPILTPGTIKNVQVALEDIALDRVTLDVQRFAEKNKMSVQKIENYEIEFSRKYKYEDYYTSQSKAINMSFLNPVYTLVVKHTFSLK